MNVNKKCLGKLQERNVKVASLSIPYLNLEINKFAVEYASEKCIHKTKADKSWLEWYI